MLEISGKTNLLEQNAYKYSLQDVAEPNLQRDIYTQGTAQAIRSGLAPRRGRSGR